jgi:hypothetical protein
VADDIVTRLREIATEWACPFCEPGPMGECGQCLAMLAAADEIERLYAEINDLRLQVVKLSLPVAMEVSRG